jgi:DNA-binding response OmpR family regulator
MMRLLMLQKGAILSKERLLVKVWGYDAAVDENSVEVYASFLRKKLQRIRSDLEIKAVRRVGYHICRQNETCVDGVAIERQRAYRLH